jgi:hypothetical protein
MCVNKNVCLSKIKLINKIAQFFKNNKNVILLYFQNLFLKYKCFNFLLVKSGGGRINSI